MVDAIVTAFHRTPEHMGIDATMSVSLLPSYIKAAAKSGAAIFRQRSDEKHRKHIGFSKDTSGSKGFLALVINHLGGIGPPEFWKWFDGAFTEAVLSDIRAGEIGRSAMRRKEHALQKAQASLMRASADMLARCLQETSCPDPE